MWDKDWRISTWNNLAGPWDLIIIGGGITGAGIFNMASRHNLKVLLLEAKDFSFGTSSRSSKLVHGGLRYLQNKQYDVVRESVKERERMVREALGLVHKLGFLFAGYSTFGMSHRMLALGASIYDLMVPKWQHNIIHKSKISHWEPMLNLENITGAVRYFDANVDDSRLVLRVIQDGVRAGGIALNYAKVIGLLKNAKGMVCGVRVEDQSRLISPKTQEILASVVINATGPWSDELRADIGGTPKLRKLRGSHIIFSGEQLPIQQAVTMLHPRDHRALFAIPWEGITMIGTTDLDQKELDTEPRISPEEVDYLLEATNFVFPGHDLTTNDIISTFAGLRPIINTGADTPSKESRAHAIWEEDGLVTISGGKLTIFRVMSADVLNFISNYLPNHPKFDHRQPVFDPTPYLEKPAHLAQDDWLCLLGRHGKASLDVLHESTELSLNKIKPLSNLWIELAYSAHQEAVVHLDDLLLRRQRLGLCLPHGGLEQIEKIRSLVQKPLDWSDKTWQEEVSRYRAIWQAYYYLP